MEEMAINAHAVKRYYVWYLIFCWFYCMFSTCIFEDWYDQSILFFYPNMVSSFVYPFELSFIFLSYPSFGIKIESKINVKKIRIKERVRKKKQRTSWWNYIRPVSPPSGVRYVGCPISGSVQPNKDLRFTQSTKLGHELMCCLSRFQKL